VLDYAREFGIGMAQFVSIGNKADVSGNDLLGYWEHDDGVELILMYVENFGNPANFRAIASRVGRTKPIIIVTSGRSAAGARAASSHTGALAASDVAVDTLLAQAGVLRAASIEELFDMAMAFGVRQAPASRRTAVITNAGGPGILAADALETCGLDVVELAPATVDALRPLFPREASIRNPLDMIASATPAGYRTALTTILADPAVDAVVPIFVPPFGVRQEEVAEAIVAAAAMRPEKPVLAVLMGRDGLPQGRAELHAAGIPAYIFPESAARALAALNRQREWAERPPSCDAPLVVDRDAAGAILARARRDGRERLDELESLQLLGAYGISVPPAYLARTAESAAAGAAALGFPVALKVVSADVVHKSDVGGVQLGIATAGDAVAAYRAILASVTQRVPGARIDGVLVQRMAPRGRELIAGVARDRDFGALVMFGLGGIFVEARRDVVFRVAPVETREAAQMLDGIRGARVLTGMRGEAAIDRDAVIDALRRIGQLAVDFPEIRELDVNPLMGYERGVMAADARVRLLLARARCGPPTARHR
jgi:acetyltransferase